MKTGSVVAGLLLLFVARHYGYYIFDGENRSQFWNASGAVVALVLLASALLAWPTRTVALICAWVAFEEVQVVLCSALFIVRPWFIGPDADQCSAALGIDLAAFGVLVLAVVLVRISGK